MGALLQAQDEYGEARKFYEKALVMYQLLYPKSKNPQGHPKLATSLNNMGTVLQAQGEYGEARKLFEQALEMRRRLYPESKYPQGHPDVADSLNK